MKSLEKQKLTDTEFKAIVSSVALTAKRTGQENVDIQSIVEDIIEGNNDLPIDEILIALKNGGLGKYGRTYKLTTQEVFIWIREYIREKEKSKDLSHLYRS